MAALFASAGSFVAAGPSCSTSSDPNMQTGLRTPSSILLASHISTTNSLPPHLGLRAASRCKHLSSSSLTADSLVSRGGLGFSWKSHLGRHGKSRVIEIVARAGGSRPPPGARRPRPKPTRQQYSDDENRDGLPVNGEIMSNVVMLIGDDGKMIGRMSKDEALSRARELDLDLVQMDKQEPPCVKIVEYSKLKYELQKRKKEQQKKSVAKRMDLKELKMRYNIDVHDYGVRLKSIQKFLKDGDKVKLIVQFKGRELEFKDLGLKLFERFQEDIGEEAIVEGKQTKDARNITMVLAPAPAPNKGKVTGQGSNTEKPNADENSSEDSISVAAVGQRRG